MSLRLAHREFGQGPPLVILHGLFGSARNWSSIARRLAETWTVYALDLRNHGESPWAEAVDYTDMAADVLGFLDERGIERAPLIGHSMGGKTAMTLALTHAERVGPLVVVDIAPVAYGHSMLAYVEAMAALDPAGLERRAEADAQLQAHVPEPGIRAFLLQNLVQRQGGFAWQLNLAALGAGMAAIGGFPNALAERAYEGRTLFLGGAESDYIRPEHHAAIYRLFPNAEFEDIPGAGHWVHAEAPESFLAHVGDFLAVEGPRDDARLSISRRMP